MNILRHLPNALTCGNLLSGCLGIVFVTGSSPVPGAYFVWASCIFDFLDGFTARLLKVSSPIGKELDSLADVVSFGVLPAMVMFQMINAVTPGNALPYAAFLITIFSALRLAKFNIDETQTESFRGMPTPANAIFITALPFLTSPLNVVTSTDTYLVIITLASSFLLVSPVELFALKLKSLDWKTHRFQFTFVALAVLLLVLWREEALPPIILLYILLSLFKNWLKI